MSKTRQLIWIALSIIAAIAFLWLAQSDAAWFPQRYRTEFYWLKFIVGAVAVLLLLLHMWQIVDEPMSRGRRARYLALWMSAGVVTSASQAQLDEMVAVQGRNIAGLLVAVGVLVAAGLSISESRTRQEPQARL